MDPHGESPDLRQGFHNAFRTNTDPIRSDPGVVMLNAVKPLRRARSGKILHSVQDDTVRVLL
jgi:hypothetical protein